MGSVGSKGFRWVGTGSAAFGSFGLDRAGLSRVRWAMFGPARLKWLGSGSVEFRKAGLELGAVDLDRVRVKGGGRRQQATGG